MVTLRETISNIKADFQRRLLLEGKRPSLLNKLRICVKQGMVGVILYRVSHFCVYNNLGFLTRFLSIIELLYCKNEVSPMAIIGPGLVFEGVAIGICSSAIIGKNCTFLGRNTLSLGMIEGVDLNKDAITIGNYCVLGSGARVMRPINIADGIQIKPNSVVMLTETKQGCSLFGIPARRRRIDSIEKITQWNPLLGIPIAEVK
ncbi:hypothetical protein [Methylotenera sp.]|uniref:hypothetical protein n=1 Tax=Methylotenera sp. TaxID=2051956 RepID=UPI00248A82E4|nr:hypothetical protein [Methylotenera sp.]MDI1297805.1 hypothetical protein [Methylotenera sp.]